MYCDILQQFKYSTSHPPLSYPIFLSKDTPCQFSVLFKLLFLLPNKANIRLSLMSLTRESFLLRTPIIIAVLCFRLCNCYPNKACDNVISSSYNNLITSLPGILLPTVNLFPFHTVPSFHLSKTTFILPIKKKSIKQKQRTTNNFPTSDTPLEHPILPTENVLWNPALPSNRLASVHFSVSCVTGSLWCTASTGVTSTHTLSPAHTCVLTVAAATARKTPSLCTYISTTMPLPMQRKWYPGGNRHNGESLWLGSRNCSLHHLIYHTVKNYLSTMFTHYFFAVMYSLNHAGDVSRVAVLGSQVRSCWCVTVSCAAPREITYRHPLQSSLPALQRRVPLPSSPFLKIFSIPHTAPVNLKALSIISTSMLSPSNTSIPIAFASTINPSSILTNIPTQLEFTLHNRTI